ncbi:MAG: DUF4190 domain-containing protein [Planctomycetaceae bacterium]|nr:DUF4190 domain-containing protein [Planctomycetaceae bacterium]
MTQVLEEKEVAAADAPPRRHHDEFNEFSYRPVPIIAVTGFILALVSSLALFLWIALPITLVAAVVGIAAIWTIRSSQGAYGGQALAITTVVLSVLFAVGGVTYQMYLFKTELPEGYKRVSFYRDISEKGIAQTQYGLQPHPDILALDGEKVFLKGFIYPTEKMQDLNKFLLLKDNGQCCFGGQPKLEDRIGVVLKEGMTFDHTYNRVSLSGTFRLNRNYHGEDALEPIFLFEADSCKLSASAF